MITQSQSQTLPRGSVSIPLSRTSISTQSKQTKYQSKVQFRSQEFLELNSEAEAIFNYPPKYEKSGIHSCRNLT